MISRRHIHHALVLFILCAFATAFMAPVLYADAFPKTHESYRYAMLVWHFTDALRDGVLYPRWLPALAGGYGYPTFVFYQPLFFYLAATVSLVGSCNAATACLVATWLAVALGGFGAYLLGRRVGGIGTGLATAALFLVTPYLYVDFYARGDLSELLAMLLTPYPIVAMLTVRDRVTAEAPLPVAATLGLGGSLALIITAHPVVGLIFNPMVGLFAMGLLAGERGPARVRLLRCYASAALLGLSLSAPYWATVFAMKHFVGDFNLVTARPAEHVVQLHQLFSLQWGFGDPTMAQPNEAMSVSLGVVHCLAACAGLVASRRDVTVRCAFAVYLLCCLLMLPLSQPLWRGLPTGLQLIQFPWRLLAVTAVFQIVCVLGIRPWCTRLPLGGTLATLALAAAVLGVDQFQVNPETRRIEHGLATLDTTIQTLVQLEHGGFVVYANENDFLPHTARFPVSSGPRFLGPMVTVDHGSAVALPDSNEHHIRVQLTATEPGTVMIQQYYFPGWEVSLDGHPLDRPTLERTLTPDGRITVALPHAGTYALDATYEGPPGWALRSALAALSCLTALALVRWPLVRWPLVRWQSPTVTVPSEPAPAPSARRRSAARSPARRRTRLRPPSDDPGTR